MFLSELIDKIYKMGGDLDSEIEIRGWSDARVLDK